jgi:Tol biopolymer transport system component
MMNNKTMIARAAVVLFAAAALLVGFTSAGAGASPSSTTGPRAAAGDAGQPATTADGLKDSNIAFTRLCAVSLPPDGCASSVEHQGAEIWTMDGNGGQPRQLTHNTTWDLAPVWSPDGNKIAFYGTQFDPNTDKQVGSPHIYLVDANTGVQMPLGGAASPVVGRFPDFSPDGTKIAFDNGADILVINADGSGTPTNLTNAPGEHNIRPAWSPDGQKIAFSSRNNGNDDIYVMNADGTDKTQLTDSTDPEIAPAWSPDGSKIVYQRCILPSPGANCDMLGNQEIYAMNANGSDQTRLTDYPGRDLDPDWSPNGRWIAFHRDINPIDAGILEVFVMNPDGSNQMALTGRPSENAHPGWGPLLAP